MQAESSKFEQVYYQLGHWDYAGIGDQLYKIGEILENLEVDRFTLKRIIFCSLEMMENVFHHSGQGNYKQEQNNHQSEFIIEKNSEYFRLCTGNLVNNNEVESLRKRLQEVKDLAVMDIRKLYVNQLRFGSFSKKGGAGLGIMEVAKISKNPIDFTIETIDPTYSYLRLFALINLKK
jgi:hypothetical protein